MKYNLTNIKSWLNGKEKLIENFLSLSVLQGVNYILPLITVPYLVRVLKPELYGLINFAQALIQYFILFTDYGFNLSATRKIAIFRNDIEKVSQLFWTVMFIKIGFMLVSFLIFVPVIFSFHRFFLNWVLYVLTFGMVVGNVMFPVWFFQGMEKMKYITGLNLLAKLVFTVAIFLVVKRESDYLYVAILNSLGFIIAGIWSLILVFKSFHLKFRIPNLAQVIQELKDGWHVFISTIIVSLYTVSNTFILGLLTNNTIVGYYSAAEKIVRAAQGLFTPITQTLYPYFSKLYWEEKTKAVLHLRKTLYLIGGLSLLISTMISIFSPLITKIILSDTFSNATPIIAILSFTVFAIGINNILGVQGLLAFGFESSFLWIVGFSSAVHLIFLFFFIKLYGGVGAAISVVVTELLIAALEYKTLSKSQII